MQGLTGTTFPAPHFSVHVHPIARSLWTSSSNAVDRSGFKWTYRRTGARFATLPTLMMDRLRRRGAVIVARPVIRPGSMTSVFGARLEQLQAMLTSPDPLILVNQILFCTDPGQVLQRSLAIQGCTQDDLRIGREQNQAHPWDLVGLAQGIEGRDLCSFSLRGPLGLSRGESFPVGRTGLPPRFGFRNLPTFSQREQLSRLRLALDGGVGGHRLTASPHPTQP